MAVRNVHVSRDWLLSAGIFLIFAFLVEWQIGWSSIWTTWLELECSELLAPALLAGIGYVFRGLRLQVYFLGWVRQNLGTVFRISFLHNLANNLLPMRSGELALPLLLKRYLRRNLKEGFSGLVWLRIMDLHVVAGGAFVAGWGVMPTPLWSLALFLWAAIPALLAVPGTTSWITGIPQGRRFRAAVGFLVESAPSPRRFCWLYLMTLAIWSCKLLGFAFFLRVLSGLPMWQALLGILGAELTSVLPVHGLFGAGTYEGGMVAALAPFGVGVEKALSAAIHLHMFVLGLSAFFGGVALLLPKSTSKKSM